MKTLRVQYFILWYLLSEVVEKPDNLGLTCKLGKDGNCSGGWECASQVTVSCPNVHVSIPRLVVPSLQGQEQ